MSRVCESSRLRVPMRVPTCGHLSAWPLCPQRRGRGCEGLHLGSLTVPGVKNPVLLGGALCGPTPRGTRHPREGGHLSSAPCVLCHCVAFAPRPGFNDPRAHFRSGALGAGGGGTCPTTESARKTPDGTKEKKPPKQALGGGGPATARPGKPHRAAPAPAPPPELGVPPARGAEGAVGPGSRPFSPTRGREPQPLVGPGLGSGRLPLPTLARLLFVGSTCVGPDKPRRTLAETVWPPKGGMEGSRRSVDSFGLP